VTVAYEPRDEMDALMAEKASRVDMCWWERTLIAPSMAGGGRRERRLPAGGKSQAGGQVSGGQCAMHENGPSANAFNDAYLGAKAPRVKYHERCLDRSTWVNYREISQ